MDQQSAAFVAWVNQIAAALDAAPDSWREHVAGIRGIVATWSFTDTSPNYTRRQWQLQVIRVFQRVAYSDADSGGVPDIANWCLRQSLTLLQLYPEDPELLSLIGQNWLLRAQPSLARIHSAEGSSSSSAGSQGNNSAAENRINTAEYVNARGILIPAADYLKRAVNAASAQGILTANLLCTAAEAYMSLGNVSSIQVNMQYFQQAVAYLRMAAEIPGYQLPAHLQQWLEEYGPLA